MGVIRYALNHTKKTYFDLDKRTYLSTEDLPLTEDMLQSVFENFDADEEYKAEVIDNLLKFEAEEIIADNCDSVPHDYVSAGGLYEADQEDIGRTWGDIYEDEPNQSPITGTLEGKLGIVNGMTIIKDYNG